MVDGKLFCLHTITKSFCQLFNLYEKRRQEGGLAALTFLFPCQMADQHSPPNLIQIGVHNNYLSKFSVPFTNSETLVGGCSFNIIVSINTQQLISINAETITPARINRLFSSVSQNIDTLSARSFLLSTSR